VYRQRPRIKANPKETGSMPWMEKLGHDIPLAYGISRKILRNHVYDIQHYFPNNS
jgi:hypothetical protein